MRKIQLFGYNISAGEPEASVAEAMSYLQLRDKRRYMACANPHSLVVAARDHDFSNALKAADMLVPDGVGIIAAARILNLPLHNKVAGTDFFLRFSREANKKGGIRYFFLGSTDRALGLIEARMKRDFPAITVCGTYAPPFKNEFSEQDSSAMIEAVNDADPDVLWLGMTAPKQEKWIYKYRSKLSAPFSGAIGAVFDFYAGTKKRSSDFWIKTGLEWLPRLIKEPRRLWDRSLKSAPIFLGWIIREKIRRTRGLSKRC